MTKSISDVDSYRIYHLIDTNMDTIFFHSIARYHDRQRFPVAIGSIAPAGPLQRALRPLNVPTFTLGASARSRYGTALLRLTRLLRRQPRALLHAHCFDPTLLGLLAARLARVPFVFTRHHSDHHIRLGKKWHTRMDAFCARHADHVIAVSEATRQILIDIEKVPPQHITVVYNGREALVTPGAQEVQALRQELGLGQAYICLMIGRLHEEKGHRYLFDAVPEIMSRVGPFVLLLAGDGAARSTLEAEAQQRGLSGVVRFLGRRADIAALIELSSVVAQPSLAESFGIAVLEAMSLGKPVVASTVGGLPEVLAGGRAGLLVPPANASALANALVQIYQDPVLAQQLGEAGREQARLFNFERMMRSYEAVYDQVLAQTSARRL